MTGAGLITIFLFASRAQGEPLPSYCPDLDLLRSQAKVCLDNRIFIQAANACLDKLDKEVKTNRDILARLLDQQTKAAASAQSGLITTNNVSLAELRSFLESSLANAARARLELVAYSQNFTWPGSLTTAEVRARRLSRFLSDLPCYADRQSSLAEDVKRLDEKVKELRLAEADANTLSAKDTTALRKLDNGNLAGPSARGRSTASVPVPSGRAVKGNSNITGTDQARRKEQESAKAISR